MALFNGDNPRSPDNLFPGSRPNEDAVEIRDGRDLSNWFLQNVQQPDKTLMAGHRVLKVTGPNTSEEVPWTEPRQSPDELDVPPQVAATRNWESFQDYAIRTGRTSVDRHGQIRDAFGSGTAGEDQGVDSARNYQDGGWKGNP